jgi:hypothetical protein
MPRSYCVAPTALAAQLGALRVCGVQGGILRPPQPPNDPSFRLSIRDKGGGTMDRMLDVVEFAGLEILEACGPIHTCLEEFPYVVWQM